MPKCTAQQTRRWVILAILLIGGVVGVMAYVQQHLGRTPITVQDAVWHRPVGANLAPPGPLRDSLIAAGDYLVQQQLSNGELTYEVNVWSGERAVPSTTLRLMLGTGALYTVCRVADDNRYCQAGDRALERYLHALVRVPQPFQGTCLVSSDTCHLGSAAITVDTVYKRWQATGSMTLGSRDLRVDAAALGAFILSMRRPEGGFVHALDPYGSGKVDHDLFVSFYPGESLLALLELSELTGSTQWRAEARNVHEYMMAQPVTEDHWHSTAMNLLARLGTLEPEDRAYGTKIAQAIVARKVLILRPANSSIDQATKVEALASLALAFSRSGAEHVWLADAVQPFLDTVVNRQFPVNSCDWAIPEPVQNAYRGGIFGSCDVPAIRVDGVAHWINGVAAYLEYVSRTGYSASKP